MDFVFCMAFDGTLHYKLRVCEFLSTVFVSIKTRIQVVNNGRFRFDNDVKRGIRGDIFPDFFAIVFY